MAEVRHGQAFYARLARELGGYYHPWTRVLSGPDPELMFDVLLTSFLIPETRVLEAGCGHGPDAARFGQMCASWTAYDFVPELLEQASRNAPHAKFFEWNGKTQIPAGMPGPFDLIVSRRGPTSVILRLPELAAPGAHFLYIGPRLNVPQVPQRLAQVGWHVTAEHRVSVLAHAPTWEDWEKRCEFMGEEASKDDWKEKATEQGMPYYEERHVILAQAQGH